MSRKGGVPQALKRELMRGIYENRMILTAERDKPEGWKLVSGLWSPFYIQLRLISSYPKILQRAGKAIAIMLKEEAPNVNRLVGIAFAGTPIATAASIESGIPACHTRKLVGAKTAAEMKRAMKEYGQHSLVEGIVEDGDVLCLVDDLVTGMDSKVTARSQVLTEMKGREIQNVVCEDVAVVVDRQQGAAERAKELGMRLHSAIRFVDEGLPLVRDLMSKSEYETISDYLADPKRYQGRT
jgi:orotate phosphoribosyltransferase